MDSRPLAETAVFSGRKVKPRFSDVLRSLTSAWTSQTIQTYAPTYIASLHLGAMAGFVTVFFVGLTTLISLPICATIADRVNRRSMLIVVTLAAAVTAYPLLAWLAQAPSVPRFVIFELWFSFLYGAYSAVQVATLVEMVLAAARTSGYAFAQALAAAVFGGFTPMILTWLNHLFDTNAMVGACLAFNALIGLAAALSMNKQQVAAAQGAPLR